MALDTRIGQQVEQWLQQHVRLGAADHVTTQTPFGTSCSDNLGWLELPPPPPEHTAAVQALAAQVRLPAPLRHAYARLGTDNREFTIDPWTFLSLKQVLERLDMYRTHGQTQVCDLALAWRAWGGTVF